MKVSILIPTKNRLDYLRESLTSARTQSYQDLEILVSDDGSDDGTGEYVESVAKHDGRVRLLTDNPTPGIFTNITHLVEAAHGDAFCVLGDDDRLRESYVSALADPLARDPSVVAAFAPPRVINGEGRYLHRRTRWVQRRFGFRALPSGRIPKPVEAALAGSMWLGACLFRSASMQHEKFDVGIGTAADLDYALRCALKGEVWFVPDPLWDYRVHRGSASRLRVVGARRSALAVLDGYAFRQESTELARRARVKRILLSLAFVAAPTDRDASRQAEIRYIQLGGHSLHPQLVLARLMRAGPPFVAQTVTDALARGREWILETRL